MKTTSNYDIYGYRFAEKQFESFFQLFAVGFELITDQKYSWNGTTRIDGPLYLFQYTISGFGYINIADKTYKVDQGYAFLVEVPSNHHYYLPKSSDSWEFYFILIRPNNLTTLWTEIIRHIGYVTKIDEDSSPIRVLKNIYQDARHNRITDAFRASSAVYHFIIELYRYCNYRNYTRDNWPLTIRSAVKFMTEKYSQSIGLEEISSYVGLSKYHFNRLFTKKTGKTMIEFLTHLRLEKAVELLRTTNSTIEEIAKQTGYTNGSYFSKVFKQHVGCSPGKFRSSKEMLVADRLTFD